VIIQVLQKLLALATDTFQTGFLFVKGRTKPRRDAFSVLIRRNTLQARLVGKTCY
jgi:hypothetical protein